MGFNPGGNGGGWDISPPGLGRGDGQCFHPPLEMDEALAHLIGITLSISMEKLNYNYSLMDFY